MVAPAGPFDRESFEAGVAVLRQRYEPIFDEGLFAQSRYLAGDDERRASELTAALTDPSIAAVFAARGGYGVMRLLPRLSAVRARPIPVVGFSDLTALHAELQRQGLRSLHGPVLTQLGRSSAPVVDRLFSMLEEPMPAGTLSGTDTLVEGAAEGPLVGGNLSVLTRLIGTKYLPSLEGAVLLLEDVGERPYRLDRMWQHLLLSGQLDRVAGVVLGEFTGCEEKGADYGATDVLRELAAALGKPCAAGFCIGHGDINQPIALGARHRLDAGQRTLTPLEPLVSST